MVRLWEIIPGLSVWLTLILPIILAFFLPRATGLFILFYTVLWLSRSFLYSYYMLHGYAKMRRYMTINWLRYLTNFHHDDFSDMLNRSLPDAKRALEGQYEKYKKNSPNQRKKYEDIYHIVIVPTYKEDIKILLHSFQGIADANYDHKRIIVVLATEERDRVRAIKNANILKQKFKNNFGHFWVVEHPSNLPNEIPGKGSNIHFAGREVAKRIKKIGLEPSNIVVTTIDADNIIHPDYLPCLTLHYIADPNRKKRSYQSLPLFFNNIWQVPIFNRLVALTSSFWHIIQSGRPNRLRNFAAHSQPFDALIEMDFWSKTSIVEDGHQFWRAYFHFKGDHEVIPLFMPIYQDAVELDTYWGTLKGQYFQLRRWAWGVTDIAFVINKIWQMRKELPILKSLKRLYILIEGHYMWATAPLIITMTSVTPRLIGQFFKQSVQAYNLAFLLSVLFKFALVGIFVSLLISLVMLPKHPRGWRGRISLFFMIMLLPINTIIFGAIPAIDAQTRLIFNKRLDFNVTKKVRKAFN